MIGEGLLELQNFTAQQDKRRYAYILTLKGISEKAASTHRLLTRQMEEHKVLKAEIDALSTEINSATNVHPKPC